MPGTNPLDVLAQLEQQSIAELDAQGESSDDDDGMVEYGSNAGDEVTIEGEVEGVGVAATTQTEEGLLPNQAPQLEANESSPEEDENGAILAEQLLSAEVAWATHMNSSQPDNALSTVTQLLDHRGYHGHSPASSADNTNSPENAASTRKDSRSRLPFNLLQTGETDICLFRDILCNPYHPSCTRVISHQTLHQKLPPGLHRLSHIERLNMITQIPELGVVLVGNQAGRVGVLTATYWQATQQAGYRVEYILPFKSQEEAGVRPEEPLMGIAVSPLQGHEYRPDPSSIRGMTSERASPSGRSDIRGSSRRFRLLMMYYDHTLLSYEISRPSEDEILVA